MIRVFAEVRSKGNGAALPDNRGRGWFRLVEPLYGRSVRTPSPVRRLAHGGRLGSLEPWRLNRSNAGGASKVGLRGIV